VEFADWTSPPGEEASPTAKQKNIFAEPPSDRGSGDLCLVACSRSSIMRKRSLITIVVGRNSLRKDGLTQFLRSADFGTVMSVTSADDCCASRVQQRQALFLIVHTGDDFQAAVEQIEPLRGRHPEGRVVLVGDRYRPNEVAAAFRAGANGYFVDRTSRDVFLKSIELVMIGETVFPPALLPFPLDPKDEYNDDASTRDGHNRVTVSPDERIAPQLSPREKLILGCLVEGDSNKHIARKIYIAEGTVKVHIKAILRKIGVHNRTQAAIWAINNRSLADRTQNKSLKLNSETNKAVRSEGPARNQLVASLSLDVEGLEGEQLKGFASESAPDQPLALVFDGSSAQGPKSSPVEVTTGWFKRAPRQDRRGVAAGAPKISLGGRGPPR
jgi:two-component system nitrate/nitrite response regulator NarL